MIRRPGSIRRVRDLGCPPVRGRIFSTATFRRSFERPYPPSAAPAPRSVRAHARREFHTRIPPDRARSGDSPPAGGSGVDPTNREAVILQHSRRPLRSTPWTTRPSGGAIRSLNSRDAFDRATVPRRSRHGESGQWRLASAIRVRPMRSADRPSESSAFAETMYSIK